MLALSGDSVWDSEPVTCRWEPGGILGAEAAELCTAAPVAPVVRWVTVHSFPLDFGNTVGSVGNTVGSVGGIMIFSVHNILSSL